MMSSKRDLLVLSKKASDDPQLLKKEVDELESILHTIETTSVLCTCTEVIDVNNYRIFVKARQIEKIVRQAELKPFQFLYNKN